MRRLLSTLAAAGLLAGCDPRPRFSREAVEAAPLGQGLPQGFLLGVGSAAYQVEGGLHTDWTEWERSSFPDGRPHIHDGQEAGRAADAWNLWPADVEALRALGANAYRFSLDWSRLQPSPGAWDEAAAERYRQMLDALRASGVEPMLTLYHFALPLWVSEKGGWEWEGVLDAFEQFATRAGQAFGARVDLWVTVNEMNVMSALGYLDGVWPPGVADAKRASQVYATLLKGHALAARALRTSDVVDVDGDGRATLVGIAHHVQVLQAASSSPLDSVVTGLTDEWLNQVPLEAVRTGRIRIFVPGQVDIDEPYELLLGSFDFLGLNYYQRNFVRADLGSPSLAVRYVPRGRPVNDVGWDLYPEGLYRVLMRYNRYGWPIYVTENGVSDASDALRPYFLRSHLYAVERAIEDGADVRGYLHWSLTDNFEWAEGYSSRFGLFSIDFDDPARPRVPRPSTEVFREAARGMGLTPR